MNKEILNELNKIWKKNGDILRPEDVVLEAKSPISPLHDCFTWDNSEAAHLWRLEEARRLIRVTVEYLPSQKTEAPVRVFVSLKNDREKDGGGYRKTVDVMSDKDMRRQLLKDAMDDMEYFQQKYEMLQELVEVFREMKKARTSFADSRISATVPA